ncbi:MAG: hypothetical protein IPP63_08365 [Chloracidobacterium sp.]|nr:hypothetical protein [Chloracidobacterium sp.]
MFNSPNDVVVGRKYENGAVIAPGAFRDVTFEQANIPAAAIPTDGTYYLFVLVGDAGTVAGSETEMAMITTPPYRSR